LYKKGSEVEPWNDPCIELNFTAIFGSVPSLRSWQERRTFDANSRQNFESLDSTHLCDSVRPFELEHAHDPIVQSTRFLRETPNPSEPKIPMIHQPLPQTVFMEVAQ
jgi:hypothetical protein